MQINTPREEFSPNQLLFILLHHSGRHIRDHNLHVQGIHNGHLQPTKNMKKTEDLINVVEFKCTG